MDDNEIMDKVAEAIGKLKAESPALVFNNVHERSTAHRLAVHMESLFQDLNIDCEYDRDGTVVKELLGITGCKTKKKTDKVLPDIIVHKRNNEEKNKLVVEIKRNNNRDECDIKKLELFTSQEGIYKYQLGLYININNEEFDLTWFKNGTEQS